MAEIPDTSAAMGAAIGKALIDKGWSQAEFCRRVGVSTKHLNQVILGHSVAAPGQLDYWAFVLGMRWSVRLVKGRRAAAKPAGEGRTDG